MSTPLLRKAKSSSSIGSPGRSVEIGQSYSIEGDQFTIVASPLSSPNPNAFSSYPPRQQSMDLPRPQASRQSTGPVRPMSMSLFGPSVSSGSISSIGKATKGLGINMGDRPEALIHWLGNHRGTDLNMEVGRCKKLRMLLRHESTSWVGAFLEMGGYKLILTRLQEILDVEWRWVFPAHAGHFLTRAGRNNMTIRCCTSCYDASRRSLPQRFVDVTKPQADAYRLASPLCVFTSPLLSQLSPPSSSPKRNPATSPLDRSSSSSGFCSSISSRLSINPLHGQAVSDLTPHPPTSPPQSARYSHRICRTRARRSTISSPSPIGRECSRLG